MPMLDQIDPFVFVGVFALLVLAIFRQGSGTARSKGWIKWRGRRLNAHVVRMRPRGRPALPATGATDAADQLRAVMAGSFTKRRVLSRTEADVMIAAEAAVARARLDWRVLAQVSLGEILASPDEAAFRAINSKRVDLLVVSARCDPIAAIEYQGHGHWQGTAPARDAVKKEALRKAGIGYIEMTPNHGPDDMDREIARLARDVGAGPARPDRVA